MNKTFECPRLLIKNRQENYEDFFIRKKKLKNYDLHWHDCFEIELVLEGSATQELNGVTYSLSKGDIYLLNPTDFHSVSESDAEIFNIMFSENLLAGELLQEILSVEGNICLHLEGKDFATATELMEQMLSEFRGKGEYSIAYIKNLLECLFIIILRNTNQSADKISSGKTLGLRKALLYLHSHFRENPSMTLVAEISGFNKNYFSTLFHNTTGKTFKDYLTELKLEYARKLVLSSNISITEICFTSGFNSLPNFLRSFKAHFGTSPGALRKNR